MKNLNNTPVCLALKAALRCSQLDDRIKLDVGNQRHPPFKGRARVDSLQFTAHADGRNKVEAVQNALLRLSEEMVRRGLIRDGDIPECLQESPRQSWMEYGNKLQSNQHESPKQEGVADKEGPSHKQRESSEPNSEDGDEISGTIVCDILFAISRTQDIYIQSWEPHLHELDSLHSLSNGRVRQILNGFCAMRKLNKPKVLLRHDNS